jgi:putative ABC transport system substrate-binding protein
LANQPKPDEIIGLANDRQAAKNQGILQSSRIVGDGRLGSKEYFTCRATPTIRLQWRIDRTGRHSNPREVEIVLDEVRSVEEAIPAVDSLPGDIDAIFFIPAPLRNADTERITQALRSFRPPTGVSNPVTPSVFVTVASDLVKIGNPSARLARQIFQGVKPADLPVETADFLATLNRKTAQAFGLAIPGDLLGQAYTITR